MKIQTTQDTGRSVTVIALEPNKHFVKLAEFYLITNLMKDAAIDIDLEVNLHLAHASEHMHAAIAKLERQERHDA